jgi:2-polyprenyl-3-methyl-5-hydroxy-6-metoxy-1,4-benzoquinol methylase
MIRRWLRPVVRLLLGTAQLLRHLLQRLKPGGRLRRVVTRAWKRVRESGRDAGAKARRRMSHAIVHARQLAYYRVPSERRDCPACRSGRIHHVRPLSFTSSAMAACSPSPGQPGPNEFLWRFGFVSGCEACGLLFANPLPSEVHLADIYSPEGDWGRTRQDDEEESVTVGRLERMCAPIRGRFDVLAPAAGSAVLDFGCGLGGLLDTLAGAGWMTYGVDPATKVAFRRHREVVDIPDTPTFDLVVLHHVLEHVTAPLAILRSLARATRQGGYAVISVPNLDGLPEHGDLHYCLRSQTHVLAYSSECLACLLATAGFELVSVEAHAVSPSGRQMVVIGERVGREPAGGPANPLEAGLAALARHGARYGGGPSGVLPVRIQAAALNLERGRAVSPSAD